MVDRLADVNLFLAAFNMIPAFPMDGGRVLRALLSIKLGFVRATQVAATIGRIVEVYRVRRTEGERFLETLERLGLEPFRAGAYALHPAAA